MNPNIVQAVQDAGLFRSYLTGDPDGSLDSWRNWMAFLKVLYGLPISEAEHEMVRQATGRDPTRLPSSGFDECLLLCGRRSGKSRVTALVGAAEAILSGREKRLAAGEIGMVAILSPTRFQSRIIHEYLRGVFDSTALLQNEVAAERRDGFKLKNGVEVSIVTGDPRSCRGFSLLACIVDEIAFFGLSEESRVRSDTELVRALRPSLATTSGPLISIGSPYAARGYAYQTYRRAWGNDDCDVLCWNAASLAMNPTLPEAVVQRAIDEDPVAARVEYCVSPGLFREDVEAYISREVVEALVVRGRKDLPPQHGIRYGAFADMSGGRHDDAALAIAHKEGRTIILDCLERYQAPHVPYQVVADMADVLKRYDLRECESDQYAAEWSKTAFANHSISLKRTSKTLWKEGSQVKNRVQKPKSILYSELLPRLTSAEVELLDDETLIIQLCSLERRTRSGGRDSIDHPPGGHDDLANVLAGVCNTVAERRLTAGAIGYGEQQPVDDGLSAASSRALAEFDMSARQYQREQEQFIRERSGGTPEGFPRGTTEHDWGWVKILKHFRRTF